jgi:hypothetical protein
MNDSQKFTGMIVKSARAGLAQAVPWAIFAASLPAASLIWAWMNGMPGGAVKSAAAHEAPLAIIIFCATVLSVVLMRVVSDTLFKATGRRKS